MTSAGGPYKVPRQNDGWRAVALAAAPQVGEAAVPVNHSHDPCVITEPTGTRAR